MNIHEVLSELSIRIYSRPLSEIRSSGHIADLNDPLHVVMLIIDFDTEVKMNGIFNFLGNSTGEFARETVDALKKIQCFDDAKVLEDILNIAARAGMTHDAIQADRLGLAAFAVSSFKEVHGVKWEDASEIINELHRKVSLDRVTDALAVFATPHEQRLVAAIRTADPNWNAR
jgi:hypothetical protein